MKDYNRLSRFISLVLRHKPEVIGIKLDDKGYANVSELINGINSKTEQINMEILKEIVSTDSKKRYVFNEDMTKIRASQGHSIDVNLELKKTSVPKFLYHGTSDNNVDSIISKGILKRNRNHVHLSEDLKTAFEVGRRHGKPAVFEINAAQMEQEGYVFYLSENNVWLCDHVPKEYLRGLQY